MPGRPARARGGGCRGEALAGDLAGDLWREPHRVGGGALCGPELPPRRLAAGPDRPAHRPAVAGRALPPGRPVRGVPDRGQPRRRGRQPLRRRLRRARGGAGPGAALLPGVPGGHEPGGAGRRRLHLPGGVGVHVAELLGPGDGPPPRSGGRPGRLRLSDHGGVRRPVPAARLRPDGRTVRRLRLRRHARGGPLAAVGGAGAGAGPSRRGLQGGAGSPARLAAAGPPRRAQPRLGPDERGDDQGGDLRLHADRLRPARPARVVVGRPGAGAGRRHGGDGRALRPDAERPEAAARLFHGGERRGRVHRPGPGPGVQGPEPRLGRGAGGHGGAVSRAQSLAVQEPAVLRRRLGAAAPPASGTWTSSAA